MPGTITICTLDSCHDATTNSFFGYRPNIIATAVFTGVWGLVLLGNAAIALRAAARAHVPFTLSLTAAAILHILGWAARIPAWRDPWARWPWMHATIVHSLAPVLLTIGVSLALPALVRALGTTHALLKPRTPLKVLLPLDGLALTLQAAGFALAFRGVHTTTPNINAEMRPGAVCLLAAHAVNMITALLAVLYIALVAFRARGGAAARATTRCALALLLAAALLAVRLAFRGALLSGGLRGRLAREEVFFLTLDAAPAALAGILLLVGHPAVWLSEAGGRVDGGGKGAFARLQDVELRDRDTVPAEGKGVNVPLVYEPPRSFDPLPYDGGRYEMGRGEGAIAVSRETSPRAQAHRYEGAYQDREEGDAGVRPYGSGGL
ncbi:hypothetical protein ACHAQA_002873 [Verticillium albo-atrum]